MSAPSPPQQAAYGYASANGYAQQPYQPPFPGGYDPHYSANGSYDASYKRQRQDSHGWGASPPVPAPQNSHTPWPHGSQPSFNAQQSYPPAYPPYAPPVPAPPPQVYPPPQWPSAPQPGYGVPPPPQLGPAGAPMYYGQYNASYPQYQQPPAPMPGQIQPYSHAPPPNSQTGQPYATGYPGPQTGNDRPMRTSIQYRPPQQSNLDSRHCASATSGDVHRKTSTMSRKRTASQSIEPTSAILAMQDEDIYLPQYHDKDFKANPYGRPEDQPDKADEHFFGSKEENPYPNLSLGTINSKPAQYLRAPLPPDFDAASSKMQHQWQTPPKNGNEPAIISTYAQDPAVPDHKVQDPEDPIMRDLLPEETPGYSFKDLVDRLDRSVPANDNGQLDLTRADFDSIDFRFGQYPVPVHAPGGRYEFEYKVVPRDSAPNAKPNRPQTLPREPTQNGAVKGYQSAPYASTESARSHGAAQNTFQMNNVAVNGSGDQGEDDYDPAESNDTHVPVQQGYGSSIHGKQSAAERYHDCSQPTSGQSNRPSSHHSQMGRPNNVFNQSESRSNGPGNMRSGHRRNSSLEAPKTQTNKRLGHRRNSSVEEPKIFEKDSEQESKLAALGVTGSATSVFGVPGPARSRSTSPVRGTTPQPSEHAPVLSKHMPKIPPPPPSHPPPPLQPPVDPLKWDADTVRPSSRSSVHTAYGDIGEEDVVAPPTTNTALTPIKESPDEPTSATRKRKFDDEEPTNRGKLRQRPDHTTPFKNKGPPVDPAYRRRW